HRAGRHRTDRNRPMRARADRNPRDALRGATADRVRHAGLRPGRVLLVLARHLVRAAVARRAVHARSLTLAPGRTVERLPAVAAAHQQASGEQVLVAGEEDPLDAAARLFEAGLGLRAGHDDHVTGRDTDHELARDGAREAGPEIGGEEQARFETL